MRTHTQFTMECFNNKYPALKLATDSTKATVTTSPQSCIPLLFLNHSGPTHIILHQGRCQAQLLHLLTTGSQDCEKTDQFCASHGLMELEGGCGTVLQI